MGQIPGWAPIVTQAVAGTHQAARAQSEESAEKTKRDERVKREVRDEVRVTPTEEESAVRSHDDADAHEKDGRRPTHHATPKRQGDGPDDEGHLDLTA